MALSKISNFQWDKILSKLPAQDLLAAKNINALRGQANSIVANAGKFSKPVAPIDFASYEKKLKFTSSAVKNLEALYKNTKLPSHSATIPAFESKKRAAMLDVAKAIGTSASSDLEELKLQIETFDKYRIGRETSVGDIQTRFPGLAKEVETEIKNHQWATNI